MSYEELTENTDQQSVTDDESYHDGFDISQLEGVKVVTLEDYKRKNCDELNLKIGQKIKQVRKANENGLAYGYIRKGKLKRKKYGYYPANIVALKIASQDVKYTTPVETLDNSILQTTSDDDNNTEVRRIFCDQSPLNTHFEEDQHHPVERILQVNAPTVNFSIEEMSMDSNYELKPVEKKAKPKSSLLKEQVPTECNRPGSKPLLAFLGKPFHSNGNKTEKALFQKASKNPFKKIFKRK